MNVANITEQVTIHGLMTRGEVASMKSCFAAKHVRQFSNMKGAVEACRDAHHRVPYRKDTKKAARLRAAKSQRRSEFA